MANLPPPGLSGDIVFRPVNRADKVQCDALNEKVVWRLLRPRAIAPEVPGCLVHEIDHRFHLKSISNLKLADHYRSAATLDV
jgi:hypothetical protein